MSTKIAPQLSALLAIELHTKRGGLLGLRDARRELRALLAVARVMRRQIADVDKRFPDLRDGGDVAACRRALRRLDSVSGGRAAGFAGGGSTVKGSSNSGRNSRRGRAAGRTKP